MVVLVLVNDMVSPVGAIGLNWIVGDRGVGIRMIRVVGVGVMGSMSRGVRDVMVLL